MSCLFSFILCSTSIATDMRWWWPKRDRLIIQRNLYAYINRKLYFYKKSLGNHFNLYYVYWTFLCLTCRDNFRRSLNARQRDDSYFISGFLQNTAKTRHTQLMLPNFANHISVLFCALEDHICCKSHDIQLINFQ